MPFICNRSTKNQVRGYAKKIPGLWGHIVRGSKYHPGEFDCQPTALHYQGWTQISYVLPEMMSTVDP
jgi:hypothetical protein